MSVKEMSENLTILQGGKVQIWLGKHKPNTKVSESQLVSAKNALILSANQAAPKFFQDQIIFYESNWLAKKTTK